MGIVQAVDIGRGLAAEIAVIEDVDAAVVVVPRVCAPEVASVWAEIRDDRAACGIGGAEIAHDLYVGAALRPAARQ